MAKKLGKALENAIKGGGEEQRSRSPVGSHTREKIFIYLTYRPFSTRTQISNILQISQKTTTWHLDKLMEKQFISKRDRGYYPTSFISPLDMPLVELFSKEECRKIFSSASKNPGITVGELAEEKDIPLSKTSKLITQMEKEGVVSKVKDGRNYRIYPTALLKDKTEEYSKMSSHFVEHLSNCWLKTT